MTTRRVSLARRAGTAMLLTTSSLVVCLILAEASFRWIIPASQFPNPAWDESYKIIRFDPDGPTDGLLTIGRFAQQRAHWHINNTGWNSEIDYLKPKTPGKLRIALVGDSYIEGLSVDCGECVAAVLRRLGAGRTEVYSFGISGAPLSQYLQMSRYANKAFDPDVLIINVVHNDFDESLVEFKTVPYFLEIRRQGDTFVEVAPTRYVPSPFRRLLKKSAFVRYLTENLKVREMLERSGSKKSEFNANVNATALKTRMYELCPEIQMLGIHPVVLQKGDRF